MPKAKEVKEEVKKDEIIVNDIPEVSTKELPLVVELPAGASKAQVEFAKTINAYAYQNPQKWHAKKKDLLAKLEELKHAPDPVEGNLKINNSFV